MADWVEVASLESIPPAGLRVVADDEEILLVRAGDGVKALSYLCSHQDMALEGGRVQDEAWVCPHHGARFSLETGEALSMPAVSRVSIYDAKVGDGKVYVKL